MIALVPMKGHSERVPNKNLRDFNGQPLYSKIIQSLIKSKYISKIIVDTDSDEIMRSISEKFEDVIIVRREKELEGDMVSMNKIIGNNISKIEGEYFIQTHSTNPLLSTETIDKAIEQYFAQLDTYDSLFGVTELKGRFYDESNIPMNHNPYELSRSQDLKSVYEENSNFYIFSRESFNKQKCRIGEKYNTFVVNKLESLDIDYEEDFIIAEAVDKIINKGE